MIPEAPHLALKLAVGITVSSALRTISHFTANLGPRFSEIIPKLHVDTDILHLERETASAICMRDAAGNAISPDTVKHFTAVLRSPYVPKEDEAVIICAALSETGHCNVPSGISVVQHIFDLNTDEKRLSFFDEFVHRLFLSGNRCLQCFTSYARILVDAVLPPLLLDGLAFEAHPQNTLVRVSRSTGKITGFVLRDLGGLRVHPPSLAASIGAPFEFLPEHCIVTGTCEEAAKKLYHTLVHNHLQRLVRVLGLHYDGRGWEIVRGHMERHVKQGNWLWDVWMGEKGKSVSGKCLVRMKIQGLYRDVSASLPLSTLTVLVLTPFVTVGLRAVPQHDTLSPAGELRASKAFVFGTDTH